MELWMKQNAPWTDRTPEERAKAGQGNLKGARYHLRVTVNKGYGKEDEKLWQAKERQAQAEDKENLEYYNEQRRREGKIEWSALPRRKQMPRDWMPTLKPIVTLTATHGDEIRVPYAVWLELGNNGRYSIIGPTIDYWGPKLMKSIQILINRGLVDDVPKAVNPNPSGIQAIGDPKARPGRTRTPGRRRSRTRRTLDYNSMFY
jgi:hypothetical protein